jgi:hypothetical protein
MSVRNSTAFTGFQPVAAQTCRARYTDPLGTHCEMARLCLSQVEDAPAHLLSVVDCQVLKEIATAMSRVSRNWMTMVCRTIILSRRRMTPSYAVARFPAGAFRFLEWLKPAYARVACVEVESGWNRTGQRSSANGSRTPLMAWSRGGALRSRADSTQKL